jgi:hypothetical protein
MEMEMKRIWKLRRRKRRPEDGVVMMLSIEPHEKMPIGSGCELARVPGTVEKERVKKTLRKLSGTIGI